jgi:hypothetical protein
MVEMVNENIELFIREYIETSQYQVPQEQIDLLRLSAEYFDNFVVSEFYENVTIYKQNTDDTASNIVNVGVGGETDQLGVPGQYSIGLSSPGQSAAFDYAPISDVEGYSNSTFLVYDTDIALPHELSHVILGFLIGSSKTELDVAILAAVRDMAYNLAEQSDGTVDSHKMIEIMRALYRGHTDSEGVLTVVLDVSGQVVETLSNSAKLVLLLDVN